MSKVVEQSSLKENLQRLLDASGLRASDLADYTQIPASTIKYILSGNTYNPRVETLCLIADYFKISIDDLYRGPQVSPPTCIRVNLFSDPSSDTQTSRLLPILDWKDVKTWFSPQAGTLTPQNFLSAEENIHPNAFALHIESEGKIVFPKNSIIIIEPRTDYREDDYVLVSINKNIPTLRKIFEDSGSLYLRSLAAPLPPERLEPPNVVWGKIIECRIRYN